MSSSTEIDMLLRYPLILPVNEAETLYSGYLPINGVDYSINITKSKTQKDCISLEVTPQLEAFRDDIKESIKICKQDDVVKFLDNLKKVIVSRTQRYDFKNLVDKYRHTLIEYKELREFYININKSTISKDLSSILIVNGDDKGRLHEILIKVDYHEDEDIFKVVCHDLPEIQGKELFKKTNALKVINEKFLGFIDKLQHYFDVMDDFDRNCWVLDPEKPTRKDCFRRIALGDNVSVIVTVDPWVQTSRPDLKFLGPERLVETFRQRMSYNLEDWDFTNDMLQEILKLIEMRAFPIKPTDENEKLLLCDTGECCICFSLRLNDKLPDIVCQNPSCEQFFHTECLYQWLTSLNSRKSFKEIHGECPNCEKHISCPLI